MKLRKCSLLQRPRLVSGLRHGLEMSIRFATVYRDTYGERNNRAPLPLFRIEIHLFDRFPRLERERTTTSIERFHGIRRKIRGIVNVATSRVAIFTDIPICLEEEAIFIASDLYASPRCIFIVFRFSTFFFFYQISSSDCQIVLSSNYVVRDSFNRRRFLFLFQIFLATCVGIFS